MRLEEVMALTMFMCVECFLVKIVFATSVRIG